MGILKKRQGYIRAYDGFDARKIARYDAKKIKELLGDPGIIRNRLKVQASIVNARGYLDVQKEFGSFDAYIWHFVDGKPKVNRWQTLKQIPDKTRESEAMSKDLKKRGLLFKEEKIVHAYPHCWRCETPLLYYPINSWYVAVSKFKKELVANNKKISYQSVTKFDTFYKRKI